MSFLRWKNHFFSLLILALITASTVSAQTENRPVMLTGTDKTNYLYSLCRKNGLTPVRQPLIASFDTQFPENLYIQVPGTGETDSQSGYRNLVIAFRAGFAINHFQQIKELIKKNRNTPLPWNVIFLFTADDENILPSGLPDFHIGGTKAFVDSLDDTDSYFAIIPVFSPNETIRLTPGGNREISPLWLVQSVNHSCHVLNLPVEKHSWYSSMFRSPILNENSRLNSFLDQNIPSIAITLNNDIQVDQLLYEIETDLVSVNKSQWDKHYGFINLGEEGLWINESFYALTYLLFAIISLFLLCYFSFVFNSKSRARFTDVLRTTFAAPVTILLSGLTFFLVELIFSNLAKSPLVVFGIKLSVALTFSYLLFVVFLRFNISVSSYGYGYLMLTVAMLNVFVFSAVDLSYIYLFLMEYIISFIARKTNRVGTIGLTILLMILPFVLFFIQQFTMLQDTSIEFYAKSGLWADLLFALALYPIQMQVMRLFIATDLFSRGIKLTDKKMWLRGALMISVSVLLGIGLYGLTSWLLLKNRGKQDQTMTWTVNYSQVNDDIDVHLETSGFSDLTARRLVVSSKRNVLRYVIGLYSKKGTPLYDSNLDYTFTGKNSAYFKIPDFPKGPVTVFYTADPQYETRINVSAYIEKEPGVIEIQTRQLETNEWK